MARIVLSVPADEQVHAKRLAARWDAVDQVWYVPPNVDTMPFLKWLPAAPVNVRSPSYFFAQSLRVCWRCMTETWVYGFALPAGYETLYVADDPLDDAWERQDDPGFIYYVEYLTPSVGFTVCAQTSNYRFGFDATSESYYWVSYCDGCAAALDDSESFCEPGIAFSPTTDLDAAHVALRHVNEPFAASCLGQSFGIELFDKMYRC
jgi:hypothetical protein